MNLVVVVICSALSTAASADFCPGDRKCLCPPNWQFWRNACYRLTDEHGNWSMSQSACREMGGEMAASRSLEENGLLLGIALKGNIQDHVSIACQRGESRKWTCEGQVHVLQFLNWNRGEPDNENHHCVFMSASQNGRGKWFNFDCKRKHRAVCVRREPRPYQAPRYCFPASPNGHKHNSTCLQGHIIHEFVTGSIVACGSACIAQAACSSFNVKEIGKGQSMCQIIRGSQSYTRERMRFTQDVCSYSGVCPN